MKPSTATTFMAALLGLVIGSSQAIDSGFCTLVMPVEEKQTK